jgi:hypothetical protein
MSIIEEILLGTGEFVFSACYHENALAIDDGLFTVKCSSRALEFEFYVVTDRDRFATVMQELIELVRIARSSVINSEPRRGR